MPRRRGRLRGRARRLRRPGARALRRLPGRQPRPRGPRRPRHRLLLRGGRGGGRVDARATSPSARSSSCASWSRRASARASASSTPRRATRSGSTCSPASRPTPAWTSNPQRIGLIGHSHVALFFNRPGDERGGETRGAQASDGALLDLGQGGWLVNPGSVGQPRDGDPRAAWLELDTEARDGPLPPRRLRHRAGRRADRRRRPAQPPRRPPLHRPVTLNCRENPHQRAFSRLAAMRQLAAFALALALGAAAPSRSPPAAAARTPSCCPATTAQEITENLDTRQAARRRRRMRRRRQTRRSEVGDQVEALEGVDPKLKQALQRGAARLERSGRRAAKKRRPKRSRPPTKRRATEEDEKPPGQEKKAEKEREKEEKASRRRKTQKCRRDTPTTPDRNDAGRTADHDRRRPAEGGGTGASGGVGPGAPAEAGGE